MTGYFGTYRGKKRWEVKHPAYKKVVVNAPDENAAMVAAADLWGARWQDIQFYTACNTRRLEDERC